MTERREVSFFTPVSRNEIFLDFSQEFIIFYGFVEARTSRVISQLRNRTNVKNTSLSRRATFFSSPSLSLSNAFAPYVETSHSNSKDIRRVKARHGNPLGAAFCAPPRMLLPRSSDIQGRSYANRCSSAV